MRKLLLASLLLILAVPVLTQANVIGFGTLCGTTCAGVQVPRPHSRETLEKLETCPIF